MDLEFTQFSKWQRQLFATALLQRMLPNYALFSKASEFGQYSKLQNLLDLVWQKLAKGAIKVNLEVQLEKLEQETPDPVDFDIFAVYPALDVCSGLVCVLQSLDEKETSCATDLSLLSLNSVTGFLNLTFLEADKAPPSDQTLEQDPLMEWEKEMQLAIYKAVEISPESKQAVVDVKAMVTSERISNLGFEY